MPSYPNLYRTTSPRTGIGKELINKSISSASPSPSPALGWDPALPFFLPSNAIKHQLTDKVGLPTKSIHSLLFLIPHTLGCLRLEMRKSPTLLWSGETKYQDSIWCQKCATFPTCCKNLLWLHRRWSKWKDILTYFPWCPWDFPNSKYSDLIVLAATKCGGKYKSWKNEV